MGSHGGGTTAQPISNSRRIMLSGVMVVGMLSGSSLCGAGKSRGDWVDVRMISARSFGRVSDPRGLMQPYSSTAAPAI